MDVYITLTKAVAAKLPNDKRRIYRVQQINRGDDGTAFNYVIATSPAKAALAVVGRDNVSLVSLGELYDAMQEALAAALTKQNGKAEKGEK